MKTIPGTLYKLQIKKNQNSNFILELWYKDQKSYEKSGLKDENELIDTILNFLEKNNLILPRNRLQWVIQEEMKKIDIKEERTFVENTVSTMIDEIEKNKNVPLKKILLMGLSNAGKTCIYERIFEGKKPWELIHSAATKGISYKEYSIGSMSKPLIWDLGGQNQYLETYHGDLRNKIFESVSILLYVIDVTDISRFEDAKSELKWAAQQLKQKSSGAKIFVLLHKIDCVHDKETILKYAKKTITQDLDFNIQFFSTSIMDESLFIAWSEVIREISPKSTFINKILEQLKKVDVISDALLIDKKTGLACGSTIENTSEDIILGMISLLIITIEKVSSELKMTEVKELSLKSDDSAVILMNVNPDLLLILLLNKKESLIDDKTLNKIKDLGNQIINQINKLWD